MRCLINAACLLQVGAALLLAGVAEAAPDFPTGCVAVFVVITSVLIAEV